MLCRIGITVAMLMSTPALAGGFALTAPGITKGFPKEQMQASAYGGGCNGENISPAVSWRNAPRGTKSFVVSLYDRDAPTGSGFWHWLVANIPSKTSGLEAGAGSKGGTLPNGAVMTRSDMGLPGYVGPCPPKGSTHVYQLTVTALSTPSLPVNDDTTPEIAQFMTTGKVLERASLLIRQSN